MPPGAWTPLAWDASANRYAMDVWQDIAVHQKTLWIATPAGLVSRDGNWSFNPDTFRVVARPASRRQDERRPIFESMAAWPTCGTTARARIASRSTDRRARPAVRLERDPFAEQTFDVDARYWAWRITGRTGSSAGRLAGTWKGEPIAVVNGRFDFDAVNSMAVFQGLLHVATNTRGWFALPVDSAALERLSRPTHPSIPPLDVAKLYANRDPDEPELCLAGRRWTVRAPLAERRHPANARLSRPRRAHGLLALHARRPDASRASGCRRRASRRAPSRRWTVHRRSDHRRARDRHEESSIVHARADIRRA